MNQTSQNGSSTAVTLEDKQLPPGLPGNLAGSSNGSSKMPYVPEKGKQEPLLKERAGILLAGAGIVVAVLLLAFGRLVHPPASAGKTFVFQQKKPVEAVAQSTESKVPINDEGRSTDQQRTQGSVGPEEIAKTATNHPEKAVAANLGAIQPFDGQNWQPAAYQPSEKTAGSTTTDIDSVDSRHERDAMEKASLVFVRSAQTSPGSEATDNPSPFDFGIGLPPGTRLRARIESAVSTAVQTPVIAVVEYNYEQNGEIVVPAGAKVFGHLEAADRSGYVGVRFDSLMMPDGSSLGMEAAATDLQLRPLKGKVEGKHTGKNILVRSFAGLGEMTATLAGRGSLNQPLSDGDLLRARTADNIAQASDEQVARLAVTERIVVSVPANTEIYVVLQKPAKTAVQPQLKASSSRTSSPLPSGDQLRQLLQLQKELSQETNVASANQ
ncbi:MAG: TrbI/VirB10 family protein [Candidatus Angelobacter sp.]